MPQTKTERLLDLVAFLLRRHQPATKAEIKLTCSAYQQASARSFDRIFARDRAELQRTGVPVKVCHVGNRREIASAQEAALSTGNPENIGYWIDPDEYFMPQMDLTPDDWLVLRVIGSSLAGGGAPPMLASALKKLECQQQGKIDKGKLGLAMAAGRRTDAAVDAKNLPMLMDAVKDNRSVLFTYHGLNREATTRRQVDGYSLVFHYGAWYLLGHCHLRQSMRVFKVSRMAKIKATRDTYDIPKDYRPEDYIGKHAWEFAIGPDQLVRLKAHKESQWLVESELGENAHWTGNEATLTVRNTGPFIRWAAANCDRVTIIEPTGMARQVLAHLQGVRELYAKA